jgi:hypothetical protein
MLNNPIVFIVGVEMAVTLLFLIGCLLFFIRGQRHTVANLEAKVLKLRNSLKAVRVQAKTAREQLAPQTGSSSGDFGELIEEQISITRNHHLSLSPDRDIVLDIAVDTPLERRAVSLRHAFLIAEKEAWLAAEGKGIDWDVLRGKLGQIIEFYEQPTTTVDMDMEALELESESEIEAPDPENEELKLLRETAENQKRHIENLERFKKLFFATDEKWRTANQQAEQYHQLLLQRSRDLGVDDDYQALLEKYGRVYDEFGASLAADHGHSPARPAPVIEIDADKPSVGRMVIANQEEIQRLRNMAVDQHKMILRLRDELTAAQSEEEKDRVIAELHKQLERHERFLKESDLCTKQLENELDRVHSENHALKKKIQDAKLQSASSPDADEEIEQMTKIIEDFTVQSSEMLTAIEILESECRDLRTLLATDSQSAAAVDHSSDAQLEAVRLQLAAAQQELLALQAQHVDLEERYLELKVKAG